MSPGTGLARRAVYYATLADLQADVVRLANRSVQTLGKWSFPQIVQHIAEVIRCSVDGFGFKAPWPVRYLIAPFIRNSLITKTHRPGFNLPSRAAVLLPVPEISLESACNNLKTAIDRFQNEKPSAYHPVLGNMAIQEWNSLMLRHAEMHMSFVVLQ